LCRSLYGTYIRRTTKDGAAFDATAERMLAAGGRRQSEEIAADDPCGNVVVLSKS
jgi:hypothetical protein